MDRKELQPLKRTEPAALPEKVLQFGGGNFLRAFTDWMIDIFNKETDFAGSVVIVKPTERDRKSTRLNSSHVAISYAVFCLKKKTTPEALDLPITPDSPSERRHRHELTQRIRAIDLDRSLLVAR